MKTVSLFVSYLFLSTILSTTLAQQVLTFTDKDSLQVGEVFELTFVVEGNFNSLSYPDIDDFEEDLEVLSRQRFQVAANRDSLVYRIQFFASENITISPKEITLYSDNSDTTITSSRTPLFFKTILTEGDEEFKPFKPIFDFARSFLIYLIVALGLLIGGYFFYRWYTNQEPQPTLKPVSPPAPFVNPLRILKESLAQLPDPQSLFEKKQFEEYYIKLGDAIRLYIKRVYEFPALEMTTREITINLQKELASSTIIKITRSVLNEADMVKFANFKPDSEQAENVFKKAMEFVDTASTADREKIEYMKFKYEELLSEQSQEQTILQEEKGN